MLIYNPEHLDMCVATGSDYKDVRFIQVIKEEKETAEWFGACVEDLILGKPREIIKRPLSEFPGPFFPMFSKFKKHRKELEPHYRLFKNISRQVDDYLIDKPKYLAKIKSIEEHLLKNKFTIIEIQAVLKAMLADSALYNYVKTNSGEYLSFNQLKAKYHNNLLYYGSIAEELKIKSNQISLLVSHGQTVGNYREVLLRNLIKQHLPQKFSIATGFIQDFAQQLDIIIYDSQNYSPLFKQGDLVVIKQEAVRAIIEVKTNLTPSTLFDALEMFHRISLPGYRRTLLPIFKGVFSFESSYVKTSSISKYIGDFYNKPYFNKQVQYNMTRDILYLYHEISCVTTLNQHCVFSKYYSHNDKVNLIPTLFSISDEKGIDIQTASFMSLLFDYLDVDGYAKKSSVWNFARIKSSSSNIKLERKLASDSWFPRSRYQNEHESDQDSIKNRLHQIDSWFNGDISTANYIDDYK